MSVPELVRDSAGEYLRWVGPNMEDLIKFYDRAYNDRDSCARAVAELVVAGDVWGEGMAYVVRLADAGRLYAAAEAERRRLLDLMGVVYRCGYPQVFAGAYVRVGDL